MVLVTGGAQGLGASIVRIFAKNGYDVIVGYNSNLDKANELKDELEKECGVKCIVEHIDITCEDSVKKLYSLYNVDIVINNSAISMDNYIEDKSYDEFMNVVSVNLGGTYLMCKYAKSAKYIINISSKDGIDTYNPISLDYCSSKAGIINLSRNLSLYYKDKKVYCVCPGWINTESVSIMNPNYLENEMKRIGQDNLLDKDYVANIIFGLINSDLVSGSVVEVNE